MSNPHNYLDSQMSLYSEDMLSNKEISLPKFPTTRYQGSKRKIGQELINAFSTLKFNSALDLFSGTGTVSLILRYLNKNVDSNDYLRFNQTIGELFLKVSDDDLENNNHKENLEYLLNIAPFNDNKYVSLNYNNIFYLDSENEQIDRFCQNINKFSGVLKDLYIYSVGQALIKKRPYNLFHRANLNMRQRDVKRSFGNATTWETPIIDHALKCIEELKKFPFHELNTNGTAYSINTLHLEKFSKDYDLIYLDPPYLNSKGTGVDYSNFYGFLEGLCDYSLFTKGNDSFQHKPISLKESNWNKPDTAIIELEKICKYWENSIIFLSYRSDGLPTPDQAIEIMKCGNRKVEKHSCGEYKYALSRTNTNEELILISTP